MDDALIGSGLLTAADVPAFRRAGHFAYESGDHGDTWLALELLVADPERLRQAAAVLADRARRHRPDLVCGPLIGGALVGPWVAHALGVPFVFAERRPKGGGYRIPRALRPAVRGARTLVVDDAINAGAATLGGVREIQTWGGRVVAVAALLVRAPGGRELLADRGLALEALVGLTWSTWPALDCPLCRAGVPLDDPT